MASHSFLPEFFLIRMFAFMTVFLILGTLGRNFRGPDRGRSYLRLRPDALGNLPEGVLPDLFDSGESEGSLTTTMFTEAGESAESPEPVRFSWTATSKLIIEAGDQLEYTWQLISGSQVDYYVHIDNVKYGPFEVTSDWLSYRLLLNGTFTRQPGIMAVKLEGTNTVSTDYGIIYYITVLVKNIKNTEDPTTRADEQESTAAGTTTAKTTEGKVTTIKTTEEEEATTIKTTGEDATTIKTTEEGEATTIKKTGEGATTIKTTEEEKEATTIKTTEEEEATTIKTTGEDATTIETTEGELTTVKTTREELATIKTTELNTNAKSSEIPTAVKTTDKEPMTSITTGGEPTRERSDGGSTTIEPVTIKVTEVTEREPTIIEQSTIRNTEATMQVTSKKSSISTQETSVSADEVSYNLIQETTERGATMGGIDPETNTPKISSAAASERIDITEEPDITTSTNRGMLSTKSNNEMSSMIPGDKETSSVSETDVGATPTSGGLKGLDIKFDDPVLVDNAVSFNLRLNDRHTKVCCLVYYGDSLQELIGHDQSLCNSLSLNHDLRFIQLNEGTGVSFTHTYNKTGVYEVKIIATDASTTITTVQPVNIVGKNSECSMPIVNIEGLLEGTALKVFRTEQKIIQASISINCKPARAVKMKWDIRDSDTESSVYLVEDVLSITVPSTLNPGLYTIRLSVYPRGVPEMEVRREAFMNVVREPIVAGIKGGSKRSVPEGKIATVDASDSYDPDDAATSSHWNVTWTCTALPQMTECSKTQFEKGIGHDRLILTLEQSDLVKADSYQFDLEIQYYDRHTTARQEIIFSLSGSPLINIMCKMGCGTEGRVSANQTLKFEALCDSCENSRENLSYRWSLGHVQNRGMHPLDLSQLSLTGTQSRILILEPGVLEAGQAYHLTLEVADAFSVLILEVTRPPSGGNCFVEPINGTAYETKFSFSCAEWTANEIFTYEFYQMVDNNASLLFSSIGSDVKVKNKLLPPGDEADGSFDVQVIIRNIYGSSAVYTMSIKVDNGFQAVDELIADGLLNYFSVNWELDGILNFALHAVQSMIQDGVDEGVIVGKDYDEIVGTIGKTIHAVKGNSDCVLASDAIKALVQYSHTFSRASLEKCSMIIESIIDMMIHNKGDDVPDSFVESLIDTIIALSMTNQLSKPCTSNLSCPVTGEAREDMSSKLLGSLGKIKYLVGYSMVAGEPPFKYTTHQLELVISTQEAIDLKANSLLQVGDTSITLPDVTTIIDSDVIQYELMNMRKNFYGSLETDPNSELIGLTLFNKGQDFEVVDTVEPIVISIPNTANTSQTKMYSCTNGSCDDVVINITSSLLWIATEFDFGTNVANVLFFLRNESNSVPYKSGHLKEGQKSKSELLFIEAPFAFEEDASRIFLQLKLEDEFGNAWNKSTNYSLTISALSCKYLDESTMEWKNDGCQVSTESTKEVTTCLCNHLTLFGSNMIVPPNTINFNTVFDNIGDKLVENLHVVLMICILLLFYLILLVIMRRLDKQDKFKWEVNPLADNTINDIYHYYVTVHTGMRQMAGTCSNVYFVIIGEHGSTEVRKLEDQAKRELSRGSVNNYILSVPKHLGELSHLRIWHDNTGTGDSASWYLDRIVIKDIQTEGVSMFMCNQWLAIDCDDGQLQRTLISASSKDMVKFQHLFYAKTRQDFSDGHIWFSLLSRPTRSRFSRTQRLSCCLALLFTTMIANAMWYRTEDSVNNPQLVHLGPFTFTPQQIFISLASSLVSMPISIIIILLFRRSKSKPLHHTISQTNLTAHSNTRPSQVEMGQAPGNESPIFMGQELDHQLQEKDNKSLITELKQKKVQKKVKSRKPFLLPFWCVYVGWGLVVVSVALSGFFTLLYSFEWGKEKSSQWLTAFLLSFIESIFLIQPIKVIGVALVAALIFKTPDTEAENEEDIELSYASNHTMDAVMPAHRKPYTAPKVDEVKLAQMLDKRLKEVKMWEMLKEIITYLLYVVLISTLSYDSRDINAFRAKEQLDKVFAREGKYRNQFLEIASHEDVFSWMENILVPNLFAEQMYNSNPVTIEETFLLKDFAYYRIGHARLRQARVRKEDQCTIIPEMKNLISSCYKRYSVKSHDDGLYGEGWGTSQNSTSYQWQYKTNLDLDGVPIWGSVDAYSGGGFVADLGTTSKSALKAIHYLKENRWLDRQSRALFIEFNVYNPNVNIFAVVSFILEFPQSGGVLSTPLIQPLRLYYYVGSAAILRVILETIFAIFTIYFIIREVKKVRIERSAYLKSFWNIIEMLTLFGSVSAIVLYGCHFVFTKVTLRKFQKDPSEFTNFQYLLIWEAAFTYCCGLLVFLSMVKMLRLLRFNRKVAELSSVLSLSMRPLSGFFMSVIIIYTAFALFAMMVFGQHALGYSNIVSSFETLFSMMLMHFSFQDLQESDPVLGPVFFVLYVVTLAFFVINMLVAILNESYNKVKVQGIETETDYKMVGYIVKQLKGLLGMDSFSWTDRGRARVRDAPFNAQRRKSMKYEEITEVDPLG